MAKGDLSSPQTYETRDANGNVIARFLINFNDTNQANLTLTSITAYNVQGSGLTQIQVTRSDQTLHTFPLPTSGKQVAVSVTDPQGLPATISCYTATVTQAQVNAQGFTVYLDIAGYTVY